MLTVTQAAGTLLNNMLDQARAPDHLAIRFVIRPQGIGLKLDSEQPGDESFTHDGRTILLLDEAAASALEARSLVVEQTDAGPKLAVA